MSDEDRTYNGWTNYETWAVGMFLDGNYTGEGTYREVLELAREEFGDELHADPNAVYRLEMRLEEFVRDACEDTLGSSSIAADLLGTALSEVNWRELAEAKLREVGES